MIRARTHENLRYRVETLEPRLLLAADWTAGLATSWSPDTDGPDLEQEGMVRIASVAAASDPGAGAVGLPGPLDLDDLTALGAVATAEAGAASPPDTTPHARTELVVLDAGVEGHEALLSDLLSHESDALRYTVHVLDADADGVAALTEILSAHRDLDAVHIVSHGSAGEMQLGSARLDAATVGTYTETIRGWANALGQDADLLLYGCELAADASGRVLVEALGTLTGADVAASMDRTGQALLGGDWDLEHQGGQVETRVAFSAEARDAWSGVLAGPTAGDDSYSVDAGDTLSVDGWLFRRQLTFDNSDQAETHADFPVLVQLDASRIDYSVMQANGEDLRFYDADGTTQLAHEIETWVDGGSSFVWVKVPLIEGASSTDSIWMEYGNPHVADGQDPEAVWGPDYRLVYHLDEDPGAAGTFEDSTTNGFDATNAGSTNATGAQAPIADGQTFNGVDQWIDIGSNRAIVNGAGAATLSAWVDADDVTGNAQILSFSIDSGTPTTDSRVVLSRASDEIYVQVRPYDNATENQLLQTTSSPLADKDWHHVVAVVDLPNDAVAVYVDGVLQPLNGTMSFTPTTFPGTDSASSAIGAQEDGSWSFFTGSLDEIRTATTARSADWVAAQYLSTSDTFITYGAELADGIVANDDDGLPGDNPLSVRLTTTTSNGTLDMTPTGTKDPVNLTTNGDVDGRPDVSPDGSKVVFESDRDGNYEIYAMDADGSNATRLTNDAATDLQPTWSPDGSQIAFVSARDGNAEIYVMDADGSNQTRLISNAFAEGAPTWSPDGSKIAFVSDRDGDSEIYVMDADGSNQTRLTNEAGADWEPDWSPDGSRIAFQSDRHGDFEIFVMDADGTNQIRLTTAIGDDRGPAWSPDGARIAFDAQRDANRDLHVMESDGSGTVRVTNDATAEEAVTWRVDGTGLVYGAGGEIYSTNVLFDGGFVYTPDPGFDGVDTFTYVAVEGGNESNVATVTITVNPDNSAPALADAAPVLGTIAEDATSPAGDAVAAIVVDGSVTDPDGAPVESIAITTVDDANGTWQFSTDNGTTWNPVDDGALADDHALLLDGTLTGAATQKLRFIPTGDYNGNATFTFRAWDQSGGSAGAYADTSTNGGASAFSAATDTAAIVVDAVNDEPSFTTPGNQNVLEDSGAHTVPGFASPASGGGADESAQTFTYSVGDDNGALFAVRPAIDSSGQLTYTLDPNAHGTATVTVSVTDSGTNANGGDDTSPDQTFDIIVGPLNDAPALADAAPVLGTIAEDATSPAGDAVAAIVVDGSVTDPDGAPVESIAITTVDDANGTWQFSTDNGTTWNPVDDGALADDHALLLDGTLTGATTQKLRFIPAGDYNGNSTFTFRAWDQSGSSAGAYADTSTNGGASAFSAATDTAAIVVDAVNDEPSFTTPGNQNVLEDSGAHTVPGFASPASGGGADESAQTFTYSVGDDNGALFAVRPAIDSSGQLTYTLDPNAYGTATVTVSVTDSGTNANGGDDTSPDQTFDIIVGALNDAPTGADSTVTIEVGTAYQVSPADFGFSDPTDADLHALLGVEIVALPAAGTLTSHGLAVSAGDAVSATDIAAGALVFTPPPAAAAPATFGLTFQVRDDGGTASGGTDLDPSANRLVIELTSTTPASGTPAIDPMVDPIVDPTIDPTIIAPPAPPTTDDPDATNHPDTGPTYHGASPEQPAHAGLDRSREIRVSTSPPGRPQPLEADPLRYVDIGSTAQPWPMPFADARAEHGASTEEAPVAATTTVADSDAASGEATTGQDPETVDALELATTREGVALGIGTMRSSLDEENDSRRLELGQATGAAVGLSVGYVSWLLRGGVLLSSVLSSLPTWRFIDPLPVFASARRREQDDDESLESIVRGDADSTDRASETQAADLDTDSPSSGSAP